MSHGKPLIDNEADMIEAIDRHFAGAPDGSKIDALALAIELTDGGSDERITQVREIIVERGNVFPNLLIGN